MTPASFEPTIDYIVTKMPRFTFEKFPGAEPLLSTSMKSVGEAMAIGRSFQESVQKALRSMETGLDGFDEVDLPERARPRILKAAGATPTPDRLLLRARPTATASRVEEIHAACQVRYLVPAQHRRHRRGRGRRCRRDGPAGRSRRRCCG